jgi:hypothetical protein
MNNIDEVQRPVGPMNGYNLGTLTYSQSTSVFRFPGLDFSVCD